MFLSLGSARLSETRDQIGRKIVFVALLAFFGLAFVIFGLAALTALLAEKYGLIAALAMMATGALICLLLVFIAMKVADGRHRARAAEQAALQSRLRQLAMLSAVAAARPKLAHMVGLGVLGAIAALVFTGRGGDSSDA